MLLISDKFFRDFKEERGLDTLRKINWGFVKRWRGLKAYWAIPENRKAMGEKVSIALTGRKKSFTKEGYKRMQDAFHKNVIDTGKRHQRAKGKAAPAKCTRVKQIHTEEKERINDYSGVVTYSQLEELNKLKNSTHA